MSGALTIYECRGCGLRSLTPIGVAHHDQRFAGSPAYVVCPDEPVEVRVFRESDVRPLWEAFAWATADMDEGDDGNVDMGRHFPAPEDWAR